MTAEWCEHDPLERLIGPDGKRDVAHVFVAVPDTWECRREYHRWKTDGDPITHIGRTLQVIGPKCPWKAWAIVDNEVYGDRTAVHGGGDAVNIEVRL